MSSDPAGSADDRASTDWPSRRLADVAAHVTVGHVGSMAQEYLPTGVPFLRSQDVAPLRIRRDDTKFISGAFHQRLSKSSLRPGDVVIVRTGRPGTAAVIPDDLEEANCADLVIVRPGPELDSRFLAYYVNTAAQRYVAAHLVGAVQQHFNVSSAKALTLRLPPLSEQRRIVEVLGALDQKIASNERLAKTLRDITDLLFAGRVVEGDAASIEDLTMLARFVNGRAFTKDANGEGRPVLRIKELNGGLSDTTLYADVHADDDNIARHHDMLFAWSGSLGFHVWHGPESLINQHIFKVLPEAGYPAWFVGAWIRRHIPEFRRIAADKATTMGHIKREHLNQAQVRVPAPAEFALLDEALAPIDERIGALAAEAATLGSLRDALLPKLITGKLRIPPSDEGPATTERAAA